MRDNKLSKKPQGGVRHLIPGRFFGSSMIIGMLIGIMLISATAGNAQRVNRDNFTRLSNGSTGNPVTLAQAKPNQRAEAQASPLIGQAALSGAPKKKAIVGTWLETVTFSGEGAPPPLKSLGTFTEDGSVVVADQGNDTTVLPFVFSPGHGTWVHLEGRTFAWTVIELISDLHGSLIATLKVRGEYTVNESGNEYTGQFKAELFDPFGNLFDSSEGTNEGRRIQVEPLP